MKTLAFAASTSTVLLLLASCVVTDVEEIDSGSGGSGGAYTGATGVGGDEDVGGEGTGAENNGGNGTGAAGGTGPGDPFGIQCGGDICGQGQACCVIGGMASCLSEQECQEIKLGSVGDVVLMKCDDAADCSGNACCVSGAGGSLVYECSLATSCPLHESCSAGGDCSTVGDECVPTSTSGSGYKCVDGNASVPCDNGECSGNMPVCCTSGTPACVAHGDVCASAFECDSGADCGGSLCCASTQGSSCQGECLDPFILCDDLGDCPSMAVPPKSCELNANVGPAPGFKVCVYQ